MAEKPLKKLHLSRATLRQLKVKTDLKTGRDHTNNCPVPTDTNPATSSKFGAC